MAQYDRVLGERGPREGARWILPRLGTQLNVVGAEHVPSSGPVLITCNHPGLTDALAIFASIERTDLRTVAADYPLLRNLPGIRPHLIFVPRGAGDRLQVVRAIVHHLRSGGAILLMPAGRIEPDPAVLPGAPESLENWSASVGTIVRLAQGTCVVPTLVSGVLAASAQRHPLTRLRRSSPDQQRLGTTVQVLAPVPPAVTVRLNYGQPLSGASLLADGQDAKAITRLVTNGTRELLRQLESSQLGLEAPHGTRPGWLREWRSRAKKEPYPA
jgi:hypothetical protein